MKRGFSLILIAAVGACAGRSLVTSGSATSVTPAPDVFNCIRQQIKVVGFSQESHDDDELRVTARKYDETVRRPDVQFRRLVHRLTFDVNPAGGDTVTTVSAQASTFAEIVSHRGPTELQEHTAVEAKEAAQTVLQHCTAKR